MVFGLNSHLWPLVELHVNTKQNIHDVMFIFWQIHITSFYTKYNSKIYIYVQKIWLKISSKTGISLWVACKLLERAAVIYRSRQWWCMLKFIFKMYLFWRNEAVQQSKVQHNKKMVATMLMLMLASCYKFAPSILHSCYSLESRVMLYLPRSSIWCLVPVASISLVTLRK